MAMRIPRSRPRSPGSPTAIRRRPITGLTLTTAATIASNAGTYVITPLGAVNPNYTISYTNGALTIAPAPLTITANDAARLFGEPNPPFSASYVGFKLGQGPGDLTGTLNLATPAAATSLPGLYPITPSGVSSLNYAVTYVNGTLLVSQSVPPAEMARDAAVMRAETVSTVPGLDRRVRGAADAGTGRRSRWRRGSASSGRASGNA